MAGLIDRCTECLSAHTLCSESAIAREATLYSPMHYTRFPHTNIQRYSSSSSHNGNNSSSSSGCCYSRISNVVIVGVNTDTYSK